MELVVKHFNDLTIHELHKIYVLRSAGFVVEQTRVCQEPDEADSKANHVWLQDENGIQAYLRVLPRGVHFDEVSIGRVIAVKRRQGLGSKILVEGIRTAKEKLNADSIVMEAQSYAREFYEKAGFVRVSDEFLEDGIPHIKMRLIL